MTARRRLTGLVATATMLAIVAGIPALLVAIGATPAPTTVPTWDAVVDALTRPDDGTLAVAALSVLAWGAWLFLTGTYCPGCGGLRAVNDLTRGDVGAAASSNLLFVASIPLLVLWWGRTTRDRWSGRVRRVSSSRRHTVLAVSFLAVAIGFAVVRNTGFGSWLAP